MESFARTVTRIGQLESKAIDVNRCWGKLQSSQEEWELFVANCQIPDDNEWTVLGKRYVQLQARGIKNGNLWFKLAADDVEWAQAMLRVDQLRAGGFSGFNDNIWAVITKLDHRTWNRVAKSHPRTPKMFFKFVSAFRTHVQQVSK